MPVFTLISRSLDPQEPSYGYKAGGNTQNHARKSSENDYKEYICNEILK